jgi:hypothetical protein
MSAMDDFSRSGSTTVLVTVCALVLVAFLLATAFLLGRAMVHVLHGVDAEVRQTQTLTPLTLTGSPRRAALQLGDRSGTSLTLAATPSSSPSSAGRLLLNRTVAHPV